MNDQPIHTQPTTTTHTFGDVSVRQIGSTYEFNIQGQSGKNVEQMSALAEQIIAAADWVRLRP